MSDVASFPRSVPPAETTDEMTEQAEHGHRRATDSNGTIVGHVRAADSAISIVWRWAQIGATLVGFGFTIAMFYFSSKAVEKALTDVKEDIAALRVDVSAYRKDVTALDKQTAINTRDIAQTSKDVERVLAENAELRALVNEMRGMREAYVYDAAKAALRKQPTPTPTPP